MKNLNLFWTQLISDLENQTRKGQRDQVLKKLNEMNLNKIPRKYRHQIAELARRNSNPILALRIMNSIIRGKESESQSPSVAEKIAYANSLTALGCNLESVDLLKTISKNEQPNVVLYMVFAYVGLWEYKKTIPLLKSFIGKPNVPSYDRLVGRVNLLAALVETGNWFEFEVNFQKVVLDCKKEKLNLLLGNAYEIKGQSLIAQKKYLEALEYLNIAEQILKDVGGVYYLFVKKWQIIAQLMLGQMKLNDVITQSEELKQQAFKYKVWELFRDLDLYLAIGLNDKKKLKIVLDSTPVPTFKQRAERIAEKKFPTSIQKNIRCPSTFYKEQVQSNKNEVLILKIEEIEPIIKSKTLWRCFLVLIQDGYKPVSLGRMHSELFPNTYFDPYSTERKIQSIISRLKRCLKTLNLPLTIQTKDHEFYLTLNRNFESIEINRDDFQIYPKLELFRRKIKGRTFSAKDAEREIELSRDQVLALLKNWENKKMLIAIGRGPSRRYMFWNRKSRPTGQPGISPSSILL